MRGNGQIAVLQVQRNVVLLEARHVDVDLQNGYLTVSAHRNSSHEDKDDNGRWLRRERYAGSCSRSFYVGEDVKDSDIHASYKDGTLCLEMPKPEAQQQVETKHHIAIEG